MFVWTKEAVNWFDRAAKETNYYKSIAKTMSLYLPKDSKVCDLGCGLGYLSQELAKFSSYVWAIDKDKTLIDKINGLGISNVKALCEDGFSCLFPEKLDGVVLVSFGNTDQIIQLWKRGIGKVFFVVKHSPQEVSNKTKSDEYKTQTFETALEKEGIFYKKEKIEESFNQPFASTKEAISYFNHYNLSKRITREEFLKNLVHRQGLWPYCHKKNKNMVMFIIQSKNKEEMR